MGNPKNLIDYTSKHTPTDTVLYVALVYLHNFIVSRVDCFQLCCEPSRSFSGTSRGPRLPVWEPLSCYMCVPQVVSSSSYQMEPQLVMLCSASAIRSPRERQKACRTVSEAIVEFDSMTEGAVRATLLCCGKSAHYSPLTFTALCEEFVIKTFYDGCDTQYMVSCL